MKMNIKNIGQLERDILQNSSGSFPVIVLDTSGLIDMVYAIRQNNLFCKNGGRSPKYERTTAFLKSLSLPIIITPRTYQEIHDHGKVKINDHTLEVPLNVVNFALDTMANSERFISKLEYGIEMDQARYDVYWVSRECCNGNPKKHSEGCSDTDREILSTIAYLSTCKLPGAIGKEINPVLVISSDAHIIQGSKFLRGFDGRYSGIVPISTRH